MADAFIQVLVENASSLLQKEIGLLSGVEKDVESLSSKLSAVQEFLDDAEEKQFTSKAVDKWLRKLKNVAYDIDDVLDEYKTEVEQLEYKRRSTNKVRASLTKLNPKIPIFLHKIGSQLKELQEKLDEIVKEGNDFHFQARITNRRWADGVIQARITGYLVNENEVRGREEDREKIVECLLKDAANSKDIFVYPIVGMGGLGKTTLAQLVFNDDRIKRHFEKHIWVCVPEKSPQNDFDVKSVISAIIESLSGKRSEVSDLAPLQKRLQELLNGKKFLLVLDDVWNDNRSTWDELKSALSCGSNGASVIVTTRLDTAAKIMGTFRPLNLSVLSDDDCWLLFKQRAFEPDASINKNIMSIAQEIVKKCKGLPLVAKTLGGFLRSMSSETEWKNVRDSELWRLSEIENSVLPLLRLSYWNLPSDAKRCFAFCAVFPKDLRIPTNQLIHLWMGNGFISSTEGLDVEDIGNQMCRQLACRSLIQDLQVDGLNNIQSFKMHDLVHDFAQSAMKEECCIWERRHSPHVETTTRHVSTIFEPKRLSALDKAKSLRTLLFRVEQPSIHHCSAGFSKFQKLRAVVVKGTKCQAFPSSLGNLKHLRHLNFSRSMIEALPDTICELWNLQSLDLTSCSCLRRLPDHTRHLRNLWYLCLKDCSSLKSTPPRLGEIIGLKTLSLFVVDEKKGCRLSELENLNLKGELHIKHLERVKNPADAKKANLGCKERLRILILSWRLANSERTKDLQVLEALQPHPNIEELTIEEYSCAHLPRWMGNPVYGKLVSIKLDSLYNFLKLPLLGELPSLKQLQISRMNFIKYIYDEIQKEGTTLFPSLEELEIEDLDSLERLSIEEGKEIFPCLTRLLISKCLKLTLPRLASVTELKVISCSSNLFLDSISNLTSLKSLSITWDNESTLLPDTTFQNLTALKTLEISRCNKLQSLPEGLHDLKSLEWLEIEWCNNLKCLPNGLYHLTALQSLTINHCPELTDFPHGFQHLISLKKLHFDGWSSGEGSKLVALPEALQHVPNLEALDISHFPNLTLLPEWIGNLTSLQTLELYCCFKLNSLPTSIQNLTKLQKLDIFCCGKELMKRCEKEIGEDWQKIAHIPDVRI